MKTLQRRWTLAVILAGTIAMGATPPIGDPLPIRCPGGGPPFDQFDQNVQFVDLAARLGKRRSVGFQFRPLRTLKPLLVLVDVSSQQRVAVIRTVPGNPRFPWGAPNPGSSNAVAEIPEDLRSGTYDAFVGFGDPEHPCSLYDKPFLLRLIL